MFGFGQLVCLFTTNHNPLGAGYPPYLRQCNNKQDQQGAQGGTTPRRSSASGRLTKIRHGSSEQVLSDRTTAHRTRRDGHVAPSRRSATSVSSRCNRKNVENRIISHKTRPYHTKREALASARLQVDQEKNGLFCRPFRKSPSNGAISGLFHHKAAGGRPKTADYPATGAANRRVT